MSAVVYRIVLCTNTDVNVIAFLAHKRVIHSYRRTSIH